MGDSEITLARNYALGASGRLDLDTLPVTGAYTTYSVQESDPALPDYVTDSAASGTAWATGTKTSNGRISTLAGSATVAPLTTIMEYAQRAGLRTGLVTTAELTDATPAVMAAHVNDRLCQGPADMAPCPAYAAEHGGPGSIAEQMVAHRITVLLGGGRARFTQRPAGRPGDDATVLDDAVRRGYRTVFDRTRLASVGPGRRVLGLFNEGNLTTEWTGAPAAPFPGSGPQRCIEGQRAHTSEPSLAEMTEAALRVLGSGFFLQVEGASIDKQDHLQNPCAQIGETVGFDRAVRVARRFAERDGRTLVVVTADHGHTSQIVPVVSATETVPRPGALSTLVTADHAKMTVSYGTRASGTVQDHTGTQVRIAASGPLSERVSGVTDQTDLFYLIMDALGLSGELPLLAATR